MKTKEVSIKEIINSEENYVILIDNKLFYYKDSEPTRLGFRVTFHELGGILKIQRLMFGHATVTIVEEK